MTVYKQPSEIIPIAVDFVNLLPTGETLNAGTSDVKVFDDTGADVTSTLLQAKTVGTTRIDARIQAGTDQKKYDVQFKAVSQNYRFEEDVELIVREIK